MGEGNQAQRDPTPIGDKWGDPIDESRRQVLWERLRAWWNEAEHGERTGPFAGDELTGAEVFWLAVCVVAGQNANERDFAQADYQLHAKSTNSFSSVGFDVFGIGLDLSRLHLEGARLEGAHLENAYLIGAHLEQSRLAGAHLEGAHLTEAHLERADLTIAHLERVTLLRAYLKGTTLSGAHLRGADLVNSDLEGARLDGADLEWARLGGANLEWANLDEAHLERANLTEAYLKGATLRAALLDKQTRLDNAILTDVSLDRIIFDNTNLSVVDWALVPRLQEERGAQQARHSTKYWETEKRGKRISGDKRKASYQAAARSYRLLVVALQAKGMSEEAAVYAYRAQLMQRGVYRFSGWRALGQWLFSWFLWLIAGYGYRPGRSVAIYLASVTLFAVGYYALGVTVGPHLSPYEAAVVSLTAFHGRGFFATAFQPGDPQAGLAALEAVFGLLIEISFIATFTQRFFGSK